GRGPGYIAPASELEHRAIEALREAGLPERIRQFRAGSDDQLLGQVDLAYPTDRVLIELDSRRWHFVLTATEADKTRYSALGAAAHAEDLAGHQVGVVAGEEQGAAGEVLGLEGALHGAHHPDDRDDVLGHDLLRRLGHGDAGRDAVDGHVVLTELAGEELRQA